MLVVLVGLLLTFPPPLALCLLDLKLKLQRANFQAEVVKLDI